MPVTRLEMSTSEPDVALELLRGVYPGSDLTVPQGSAFSFDFSVTGDERFSLLSVDQRSAGRAVMDAQSVFVIGEATRPLSVTSGRREFDTDQPYLYPIAAAEAHWDTRLLVTVTQLDEGAVRELLGHHFGRPGLMVRFDGTTPVSPERARLWTATAAHARDAATDLALFESALLRDALFRGLVAALVAAYPSNLLDLPAEHDGATATPAAVRRAIAFMEANVTRPISVADIADAARLSPRGLQEAFQRVVGDTPTRYLRRIRLEAARADLQRGERTDGSTVAQIARNWGFTHVPRFAAYYRETFGESPRDTLSG
ncbi:helix-turn-helix transcriptional regulator [Leifsonia aquatica]|uniref:helix-turn-helix transcriptional regulator n=1 Tax=Leifsonia aquatica TaxID=144185 RepID=UPI00046A4E63|nr:helix-turn-helix transcriptional regulator [Leifsonia aquatica]